MKKLLVLFLTLTTLLFAGNISQATQETNAANPVVEHLDGFIDINHFYDDNGRLVFDQLVFWDWNYDENRFNVRAWRLIKSSRRKLGEEEKKAKQVVMMEEAKKRNNWEFWPADLPYPEPEDEWIGLSASNIHLNNSQKNIRFIDGDVFREIRFRCNTQESWTQVDPELIDRERLPKEKRKEFYVPQKRSR